MEEKKFEKMDDAAPEQLKRTVEFLGAALDVFHFVPTLTRGKQTETLTFLPSTPVGAGPGCSSCCVCVPAAWDRPTVTLWVGLPEETSNSVRTFL